MLSNQSIKIQISGLSIAKSTVHQYDFIQQIVQSNWSSFYLNRLVNNSTSQHLSIIYSATSSTIARVFYPLQLEKDSEIHALTSQIDVFFSLSFETSLRFVRQHLVYSICSTISFENCTSIHLHHNSKYLTKTYAFVRQIDALSSASFKRLLNSISISISLRHHENLYFRDFYKWYDFDFFFVEVVIHIRKAISESVNHSILFQRNTSSSFQSNHDRRWLFKKKQFNKFEWYEMSDLLFETIHEILHFQVVAKTFSKRITLLVRSTTSAKSRVEKYCCKVENRISFCFARQISWHIREQTSESRQMT